MPQEPRRWEVEMIRGHTYIKKNLYYLVMWKDTWEPWTNLENCQEVLETYHESVGHSPPMRSEDEKCSGCQKFTHITNFPSFV